MIHRPRRSIVRDGSSSEMVHRPRWFIETVAVVDAPDPCIVTPTRRLETTHPSLSIRQQAVARQQKSIPMELLEFESLCPFLVGAPLKDINQSDHDHSCVITARRSCLDNPRAGHKQIRQSAPTKGTPGITRTGRNLYLIRKINLSNTPRRSKKKKR